MDFESFFNSEMGNQLTNIGTQWITKELKLTGSGNKNPAIVKQTVSAPQVVSSQGMSKNNLYLLGGATLLAVVLIFTMRK